MNASQRDSVMRETTPSGHSGQCHVVGYAEAEADDERQNRCLQGAEIPSDPH